MMTPVGVLTIVMPQSNQRGIETDVWEREVVGFIEASIEPAWD